jgi:dTDP-4-amino-4,6-dideoxygalactose transaminase
MKINWWKTELKNNEAAAAANAIRDRHISNGLVSEQFEKAFAEILGVKYAITAPSGTMALVMSLLAYSISVGDEVIVPASTWISTAHAPLLIAAKPVFVDVQSERPLIDQYQIEAKVTERTKAIIPVHLNGMSANMEEITKIAERHGLIVIEDACQALLSKNEDGFLGTQSNAGCFSLGATKLITTGQGGMIVTNDAQVYRSLKLLKNNGMEDINTPHYVRAGANFKFSDILAAVGLEQLKVLNENAKRVKEIYMKYRLSINTPHISLIPADVENGEVPVYTEALTWRRQELLEYAKERNIDLRVLPPSLKHAPQFENNESFPNAEKFGTSGLYLPSGPGQSDESIDYVIEQINDF